MKVGDRIVARTAGTKHNYPLDGYEGEIVAVHKHKYRVLFDKECPCCALKSLSISKKNCEPVGISTDEHKQNLKEKYGV